MFDLEVGREIYVFTFENDWFYCNYIRVSNFCQSLCKVFNVFDLCRLSDSKAIGSLKSFLSIKLKGLVRLFEYSCVDKEAANNGARSTFSMITMKNGNSLGVLPEEVWNLKTNVKKQVKCRTSMVFPIIAFYIPKLLFINLPTAQVYSDVFIVVIFQEKLRNRVDRITIEFLYSGGRECHSNDPVSNISQV